MVDKNILAMSDEELLALGPNAYEHAEVPAETEQKQEEVEQPETSGEQEQESEQESETDSEKQEDEQDEQEESEQSEESDPVNQNEQADPHKDEGKPQKDEQKAPEKDPKQAKTTEESGVSGDEAKAQLAQLFAPFKASGREIKVNSVEEAIQLMQKGLNYHDKMAGLKPSLNVVRMLEREGLLDTDKLNHLIDIYKKKPEAIAKLVKDSGVDLLEVDDQKVAGYKPTQHGLSEAETALEDVLTDLKQSPAYERVIDFAGNRLDNASKQLIVDKPHVLQLFAQQIETGVFDLIQAEVSKQKVLGKLQGLNDLQAYDAVGKALHEQGAFNHLNKAPAEKQIVIEPKAKKPVDPAVAAAKAAAAPAKKSASSGNSKPNFNPLAVSDEEFEKLAKQQY